MKNRTRSLVLLGLLPLFSLCFTSVSKPDITGAWRMTAHRISPANKDGISDLYAHFKDLYGGCREDMGVTFNADGSLKTSPVRGCQNPLGNLIMKAAASFMPSGKTSWETTDSKIVLKDTKGNQREYDLRVTDAMMQWLFDEKDKDATVQHTIEFKRE